MKRFLSLLLCLVLLAGIFTGTAMQAQAINIISSVSINEVAFPNVNYTPTYMPQVPYDAGYRVVTGCVSWYDMTAKKTLEKNEGFIYGHIYYVDIVLESESGYEFSHSDVHTPTVSAKVDGYTATAFKAEGYQAFSRVKVRYTFPNACGANEVSIVRATSEMPKVLYKGDSLPDADTMGGKFNVTEGAPAIIKSNPHWLRWNGSKYEVESGKQVTAGKYRYMIQMRINSQNLETALANDVSVWIDGKQWSVQDMAYYTHQGYSLCYLYSPEYVVDENIHALSITTYAYSIPESYQSKAIQPYDLNELVSGGVKPYTFAKISGPDWLSVAPDGTVTGTPAQIGSNSSLRFKVTDANGSSATEYLTVGYTDAAENWREPISVVNVTWAAFPSALIAGQELPYFHQYAAHYDEAGIAHIEEIMGNWVRIESGEDVTRMDEHAVAEEGRQYCYQVQLRIDGEQGKHYILADSVKVTVNGVEWKYLGKPYVAATFSMNNISSPVMSATSQAHVHAFTIRGKNEDYHWWECACGDKNSFEEHVFDNAADTTCNVCGYVRTVQQTGFTVSFYANGGSGNMAAKTGISGSFTLPACAFGAPADKQFSAWAIGSPDGPQCMANTVINVTKNTAVYAVWVQKVHKHGFALEVVDPTCTTPGYYLYTCACGYSYTENEVPALGHLFADEHTYAPQKTDIGYSWHICANCDLVEMYDYTAPTGKLTLKCTARTANAQKLTWKKLDTATGYQVQISTKDGKKWSTYATIKNGEVNTYVFKNLAAGNNYKFRVRFYIVVDGHNYFSPWSATYQSPTLPAGTTLTKLTGGSKSFSAQWKQNKAVTGYQIRYSTKSNFSGAKTVTIKNVKTLKATVKKLSAKKTYYVSIRTYRAISKVNYFSAWSKTYKVKTK